MTSRPVGPMKDIQNLPDTRRINIRKVGVRDLRYPVIVLDKAHKAQRTVATVGMFVNLPHQFKGTHMSRFVEILNRYHERFTLSAYQRILEEMKARLNADAAHLEMSFPYFFAAAGRGGEGLSRYQCRLIGELEEELDLAVSVEVPSPGGALATVTARMRKLLWIEDLIALVETALTSSSLAGAAAEEIAAGISAVLASEDALVWHRVLVRHPGTKCSNFALVEAPEWQGEEMELFPANAGVFPASMNR